MSLTRAPRRRQHDVLRWHARRRRSPDHGAVAALSDQRLLVV